MSLGIFFCKHNVNERVGGGGGGPGNCNYSNVRVTFSPLFMKFGCPQKGRGGPQVPLSPGSAPMSTRIPTIFKLHASSQKSIFNVISR